MRNARGSPPTSITPICLPTLASSSALAPTMALMIIRHAYQYVRLPPLSPTTTLFPRGASTHALPITLDIWARSPPAIKSACQVSKYISRLPVSHLRWLHLFPVRHHLPSQHLLHEWCISAVHHKVPKQLLWQPCWQSLCGWWIMSNYPCSLFCRWYN